MENSAVLDKLINMLCAERGSRAPELGEDEKPDYFRALCNVRPPLPVTDEFLELQDEYLSARTRERGTADVNKLSYDRGIALWQGRHNEAEFGRDSKRLQLRAARLFYTAARLYRQCDSLRSGRSGEAGLQRDDARNHRTERARESYARLQPAVQAYISHRGANRKGKREPKKQARP